MGVSRTDIFTKEQNEIANLAKVLGHPARVAIIQHLFRIKTCVCGDLVNEIGLAQATISQHLKELKQIGIIKGNIDGTRVCYCIDESNWKSMKNKLTTLLNLNNRFRSCC